ncbi:NLR family CARD domain-containing protein 3-like isoform X2 [Trichomycterus rosablanca]|uniref:NLR family CARD domain-containing protein 3-like isoform X2 n=1 Tax=Trichomycterus rosablanca TaxID=2290929 RepID=UPI002F3586F2
MKSDQSMSLPHNFKAGTASQKSKSEGRSNSPAPSGLSMKSDQSMSEPHTLKDGRTSQRSKSEGRSTSPAPSGLSMKSDQSMSLPHNFKAGTASQRSKSEGRSNSPAPSGLSMKSDQSMSEPPTLKAGRTSQRSKSEGRSTSPAPSGLSMKSDHSMNTPKYFKAGTASQRSKSEGRSTSPAPSGLSMKSDHSMNTPKNFKDGTASQRSEERSISPASSQRSVQQSISSNDGRTSQRSMDHLDQKSANKLQKKIKEFLVNIFDEVETMIIGFVKHELEMFKKFLRKENTNYYGTKTKEEEFNLRDDVLNITLFYLKKMKHEDVASALQNELTGFYQGKLKLRLKKKYQHVWEGISKKGESTVLNQIYTDLYITEGGAGTINQEHEMRQIEKQKTRITKEATVMQQEQQIECQNMFEPLPGQDKNIRTVLTQGVAGIGKSICVQKFVLDWTTVEKYQDISFIFPLPFRELNLKSENHRSLMDIISEFFPETKGLRFTDRYKVMFILDGLDECRLPLAFQENKTLTDASMPATLDVILTSLIKGDLLPSALIWITTRPAAAARIPAECVDRVAEVRGFNDQQKEEYFRKRISDESLANNIIKHIKTSRSLYIMCHIPVFCWISATVLEKILKETEDEETPKTLTEMYTCFLIFQTIQENLKYTRKNASDIPWNKEAILGLGKLAFQHLEKNNLIFYAEDLEECGIDVSKISAYSGLCTQETSRFAGTVFSFVHLSIQEFIASLYAYMRLRNENVNVFDQESGNTEEKTMELLRTAVDKALESNNGHLDLFLRFLLGLTVDYNQKLIQGLLKSSGRSSDCQKEIAQYIKMKFNENPSPERSINLFYCLNELNDDTLVKEIQNHLSSGHLSEVELSPAQWSALVFVLLTSEEDLDVFNLQKFIRSDECFMRLLPVIKESKRALLSSCNLTDRSCSALLTILNSESNLTEVDLSNNDLQDSGVELISAGLKNQNCKLEILSLMNCSITDKSCTDLKSALDVNPSHLKDLDLSNNQLGDSGVIQISHLLKNPQFKLHKLTLSDCGVREEGYAALAETLKSNPSSELMELDLRGNHPGDSGVKPLYDLLQNKKSKLNTLSICRFLKSPEAEEVYTSLYSTLGQNPLILTQMKLERNPGGVSGDSRVRLLSAFLQDSHCKLQKLQINDDDLTMESCSALSEVLRSGSSSLRELDLSNNNLQNSGVQKLCEGLKKKECKLEVLRLSDCGVGGEGYVALAEALNSNRSYMKELDLRGNHPGESGVHKICTVCETGWQNKNEIKLRLFKSPDAEEAYTTLNQILGKNILLQKELHLSSRKLEEIKVNHLSALLEDPHCTIQNLTLCGCSLTENDCTTLVSALSRNPSHLTDLDLSENPIGNSGVKKLVPLLQNHQYKLERLKLCGCSLTENDCTTLVSALSINPSYLTDLDLSQNPIGNSGVKELVPLLQNHQYKLERLKLSDCGVGDEGYAALAEVLRSNRSNMKELDLRGNHPGESGVQKICSVCETGWVNKYEIKLRLFKSPDAEEAYTTLNQILGKNILLQKKLDLSSKSLKEIKVNQLSALLEDPHCTIQNLTLYKKGSITEEDSAGLLSALVLNPAHLRELNLNQNKPGESGVRNLCELVKNPRCKLEKLKLNNCSITEKDCRDLASALQDNPSYLKELDLSQNGLEKSVKQLFSLLKQLKIIFDKRRRFSFLRRGQKKPDDQQTPEPCSSSSSQKPAKDEEAQNTDEEEGSSLTSESKDKFWCA